MASKLTDITTSFHSFQKDQILTEKQLNEFLDYFDDQDRLTRISLSGVGIVCGFNPILNVNQNLDVNFPSTSQILIKQGCGVTTDGDLIHLRKPGTLAGLKNINLPSIVYSNYRTFIDDRANYQQFIRNGSQIPIWEILPSSEVTDLPNEPLLSSFSNLQDMVTLLYVESYEDEPNLCDGVSCDNQGIQQVARLRVLMVSQADADHILSSDLLFNKHELMSTYLQMKDLSVKRVLVNSSNTFRANDLRASFDLSNEATLITDLKNGLTLMQNKITQYYQNHPIAAILTAINAKLPAATASQPLYFQYRYDLLKDIVDTYNEAKELFIEVSTECCPSITSFPKHLMLGKFNEQGDEALIGRYRHKFYKSPILVDNSKQFEPFIWTLFRMLHQLNAYPALPETSSTGLYRQEVKITPSKYRAELGKKAIPFYYNLTNNLLRAWSIEKTLKGKYKQNFSYNTSLLDTSPRIQTPLRYNLEGSNFLRIEGHQGRDYKEVMAKIDQIKKENGLSFDLKAISIDIDSSIVIDTTNYECEFEDLAVLLQAWVKEQECTIAKVISLVSAFSVKEPGRNIKDAQFTPRTISFSAAESAVASPASVEKSVSVAPISTPIAGIVSTAEQRQAIANNQQEFGRNNVVLENLTPTEFTVGHSYLQATLQDVKGSPAEFIAQATAFANDVVITNQVIWKPDEFAALVKNSIQIMAYAHVLSNSIPLSVGGITDDIISRYNININNLCSVLNQIQVSQANVTTLSANNKAILSLLITQLSSICCASKQLQTLLVEIDRRKDAILEKLTLKKFAEQHPGLEHMAGVEQGGTFVLVYLRKGATQSTPAVAATSPVLAASTAVSASANLATESLTVANPNLVLSESVRTTTKKSLASKKPATRAVSFSALESSITDVRAVALPDQIAISAVNLFNAPNGTVIADFSLPYMCCSDCAPINFIMPAPVVRLSLPKDILCLVDESIFDGSSVTTLTFTVEPVGGIIKADQEIPGMTIVGNQLSIDAAIFPDESLEKVIHFTVNDQITTCQLTVVRPLNATIGAPVNPITNPIVNFLAQGSFPTGTRFLWDFGDGNTSTLQNATNTYTLPVNEANSLDVTLTVSPASGACPTIVTHNLVFDQVRIALNATDYCFKDTTAYDFTITPTGALVSISGAGVDVLNNTFTPSNSIEGVVPIYLDGEEVFTVNVNPSPSVAFTGVMSDFGLQLTGIASNEDSSEWRFTDTNGNEIFPPVQNMLNTLIPMEQLLKLPSGSDYFVTLYVTNACDSKKTRKKFVSPKQVDLCTPGAVSTILKEHETVISFIETNPFFGKLSTVQQGLFFEFKSFMDSVAQDPASYVSGSQNALLAEKLTYFINRTYTFIQEARGQNPDQVSTLTELYRWATELLLACMQCQNEGDLKALHTLLNLITSHLDPASPISFKMMEVDIDPIDQLLAAVNNVIPFRVVESVSWTYLNNFKIYLS